MAEEEETKTLKLRHQESSASHFFCAHHLLLLLLFLRVKTQNIFVDLVAKVDLEVKSPVCLHDAVIKRLAFKLKCPH